MQLLLIANMLCKLSKRDQFSNEKSIYKICVHQTIKYLCSILNTSLSHVNLMAYYTCRNIFF